MAAAQVIARPGFGAQITAEGVRFRLWAPAARSVDVVFSETTRRMKRTDEGWHELLDTEAAAGTLYQYQIDGELLVPDPASRFQPQDVDGPSEVIDPGFAWNKWKGRPWEEAVIYELHVGTFTPEGSFLSAIKKIPYLKDLGITAIELMPLADFAGRRNWGYDGVLAYAPDSAYGRPEDLKALVNAAHRAGLMVLLDVVYNHFGPKGNYLSRYAPQFFTEQHHTPWGAAIDFSRREVRDFFIQNARYWLEEYRFDGLRFDAVHAIVDDSPRHILDEIRDAAAGREAPDPGERCEPGQIPEAVYGAVERRRAPRLPRARHRRVAGLLRFLHRRAGKAPRALPGRGLRLPGRGVALQRQAARRAERAPAADALSSTSCRTTTRSATARSASACCLCRMKERSRRSPPSCCWRRRRRCCSWARSGAAGSRSSSSATSPASSARRCAPDGGASSRRSARCPIRPRGRRSSSACCAGKTPTRRGWRAHRDLLKLRRDKIVPLRARNGRYRMLGERAFEVSWDGLSLVANCGDTPVRSRLPQARRCGRAARRVTPWSVGWWLG